jgi:glycosyltransferase involved in cell wall biosynthesis
LNIAAHPLQSPRVGTLVALSQRSTSPPSRRRYSRRADGATCDDAALYFEPQDAQGLEAQISRVLTDATLREQLAAAGPLRAAQFRWDVTASQTLAVLRKAAGDSA